MITTLKRKIDGHFYCNNCKMGQYKLRPSCFYCGFTFSNYEDIVIQLYEEEKDERNKEEQECE